MANQFELNVHDINVQDTTTFGRQGQVQMGKRVTFYVGSHGPFTLTYTDQIEANTARIKSDIDAQVMQLRELTTP